MKISSFCSPVILRQMRRMNLQLFFLIMGFQDLGKPYEFVQSSKVPFASAVYFAKIGLTKVAGFLLVTSKTRQCGLCIMWFFLF